MSSRAGLLLAATLALALSIPAAASAAGDFSGLVDIGGGRKMFLECSGTGSPTVVLISGKGNGAADWQMILAPADSVRSSADDAVGAGEGRIVASDAAVYPEVSRFTRVCAYDRPGTRLDGPDISTPIAQPGRADEAVDDLQALLRTSGEAGPYVLVAHSYGGLIALLFARLHPDEVAGLVMVDAASDLIARVATADELAGWDAINRLSNPAAPEAVEVADAMTRIAAAPMLAERPAVVLSADKPWRLPPVADDNSKPLGGITFAEWSAAQDRLAAALGAPHIAKTNSGHNIYLYHPAMVVDAIREVVDAVRAGAK